MMKLGSLVLTVFLFAALRLAAFAQEGVSINIAPPTLPTLEQPPCPADGYIWTPGYWAYGAGGYYWVPGAWVWPPQIGLLWTPPWWGFNNGAYVFHAGYWGPSVGYYGGINYGHGYFGHDYWGGRWEGNVFRYNTAVTRVDTNVVQKTFVDESVLKKEPKTSRAGFNGPNGVKAEPNAEEKEAEEHRKTPPSYEQVAQQEAASKNRNLHASVNNGTPNAEAIRLFNEREETPEAVQGTSTAGGAGKPENQPGNVSDNRPQGAAIAENQENKPAADNQRNKQNIEAEQAKAAGQGTPAREADRTTKSSRRPEKAGGNRGRTTRQQQRKKKSTKPKPSPRPR
jgi:YXWGXW repeat-containing protein